MYEKSKIKIKNSKIKKTIREFVVAPSPALPQNGREQHNQLKKLLENKLGKSSKYKKQFVNSWIN
jgi:hypothetical protein